MLIGVNGLAKEAVEAYIGVSGKSKLVEKIYVGVDGKARLCYQRFPAPGTKWELRPDGYTYVIDPEGVQIDKYLTNGQFKAPKAGKYKLELHGGGGGGSGGASFTGGYIGFNYFSPLPVPGSRGGGSGMLFDNLSFSKNEVISVVIGKGGRGGAGDDGASPAIYGEDGTKGGDTTFGQYVAHGGGGADAGSATPNGSVSQTPSYPGGKGDADGIGQSGSAGGSGGGDYGETYGHGGDGGEATDNYAEDGENGTDGIAVVTYLGRNVA